MAKYNFVPRHMRLGIVCKAIPTEQFLENVISVPIESDGVVIGEQTYFERVLPSDHFKKYRVSDFNLRNLLDAGVPLDVVNIHFGNARNIVDVENVLNKLQGFESLLKDIQSQKVNAIEVDANNNNNVVANNNESNN